MNFIDYIVIALVLVYILHGVYRGFLTSLMNMGAVFLSWIISFLAYPLVSAQFVRNGMFDIVRYFIGGSDRIAGGFEVRNIAVSSISADQLDSILQGANLPFPYGEAVSANVANQAFASSPDITTIGDYFEATFASIIVNIAAFALLYIVLRVAITVITNGLSYSMDLPQLKHFDSLLGGGIGLLRGVFAMYIFFLVVPIVLIALQVSFIEDFVSGSAFSNVFYSNNIILHFISGSVPL